MRRDEVDPAVSTGVEPEGEAVRARFFFVVARTRLDLFLAMRRQFQRDRTVHVLLDRRESERRCRPSATGMPDRRRQAERRRPRDHWEDIAHHPAVLVRRSLPGPAVRGGDAILGARPLGHEEGLAWSEGAVDVARLRAWITESEQIVQQQLPRVFGEVTVLESLLNGATGRCRDLQEQNAALRAEVVRAVAAEREMEQAHAEMIGSVRAFLWQLTAALEQIQPVARSVVNADRSADRGG